MATCITLCRWADQAVAAVGGNLVLAAEYRHRVAAAGGLLLSLYWTRGGGYDVVLATEWPDEAAVEAAVPVLNALPGLRAGAGRGPQTLRVQSAGAARQAILAR